MDILIHLFRDYTLRNVLLGALILGGISGVLGALALLRRQSLLGDTISHAALPGIALAFLFSGSKSSLILLTGAALSGWLATLFMLQVVRSSRIKDDTALGLVLSVFFGFGLVLLTFIQKRPDAAQAGLDKFLFGQAATLMAEDVRIMAILSGLVFAVVLLLWKEFKVFLFDTGFAESLGFPTRRLDVLLLSMLVITIVIGLQTVGVVLMSAMVVAPAAAARQWTHRLERMVLLSGAFGMIAGVVGSLASSVVPRLPTGPTIVVVATILVLFSLLFAPARGILWNWFMQKRNQKEIHVQIALLTLLELAEHHHDFRHQHSLQVIQAALPRNTHLKRTLQELRERGWVDEPRKGYLSLTPAGVEAARKFRQSREGKA
ncbi:MAG: metal ABC transporter permease [Calditrichaeota bacterium]|nr:metal ABC transporter permease [Calditrichota bacterium]